jgi:hypothetical protein
MDAPEAGVDANPMRKNELPSSSVIIGDIGDIRGQVIE